MSLYSSTRPYLEETLEDYPELGHFLISGGVSLATKNPFAGMAVHAVVWHSPLSDLFFDEEGNSRGGGGPSAQTQSPPSSKRSRQGRASAQVGKSGGPARASQRGSRPRRKSCPKGHYWSFKQNKCVKSKFR